jgi:hypothetical protein
MSRDTVNGTRVNFGCACFIGVSCRSALPQFVKTARSGGSDLAYNNWEALVHRIPH